MLFRLLTLVAMLSLTAVLFSQSQQASHYQVYGGYTFLSNSFNGVPGSRQSLNGIDSSIAFAPWHSLRFKIDAFGYLGTNLHASQDAWFIMGGGQYGRRFGREYAFVEGLAGDGRIDPNWGADATTGETASFSTILGGGLDTPLNKRFAWRISGGYQWSNFALAPPTPPNIPYRIPGLPNNFARLSTGVVWSF